MTLDIYVDGVARTKGSWRPIKTPSGKVRMIPQTDEKPWALAVAWTARAARPALISKPRSVSVALTFDVLRPKKARNEFPPGDADKLARSCLDALTGIAYEDDAQVVELVVRKRYADKSGARVQVALTAALVQPHDTGEVHA